MTTWLGHVCTTSHGVSIDVVCFVEVFVGMCVVYVMCGIYVDRRLW